MNTIAVESIRNLLREVEELGTQIGNTPLWEVKSISTEKVKVYAKPEWMQLGGSIKARPAYHIIRDAILHDRIRPGKKLLDASSGNTGIAYAAIGASLGIDVTICLPSNASQKRKAYLRSMGAELILTSPLEGTDGAQDYAKSLVRKDPSMYYYADQYNNKSNWKAHYEGTANEIWNQTSGKITHFVAGLGTTGTITGNAKKLRKLNNKINIIGLEPDSPMHGLEGWKHLETAKVPGIYNQSLLSDSLEINSTDALAAIDRFAKEEGWLLSPSSAANLLGAEAVAKRIKKGVVVTVMPDDISKYDEITVNW